MWNKSVYVNNIVNSFVNVFIDTFQKKQASRGLAEKILKRSDDYSKSEVLQKPPESRGVCLRFSLLKVTPLLIAFFIALFLQQSLSYG